LVIDIDHLEEINTQLGPDAGDILVKPFACQSLETLRHSDMCRMSRRRQVAVLFPLTDLEKISPVIARLRHRLAEAFDPGCGMLRAFSSSSRPTLISKFDRTRMPRGCAFSPPLIEAHALGGNQTLTHSPAS
jgi:GGDEF domain-containing protein